MNLRNFFILIFLGLITFVFWGCFTVNSSENAIVLSQSGKTRCYTKPGLYFRIPIYEQVELIYMNNREAFLSIVVNPESGNNYKNFDSKIESQVVKVDLLVNWHVTNPRAYRNLLVQNGQISFDKMLFENISKILLIRIHGLDVGGINQLQQILPANLVLAQMGLSLDNISITSTEFVQNNLVATAPDVPKPRVIDENASIDLQNKMIESSFYQAEAIKTQTEIYQARMYDKIKRQNPKFYNYFRLIDVYKNSAKSKADVPPLNKLYY